MPQGPRNLSNILSQALIAEGEPLDIRVQKRFTPRLWSKTLLDQASFEGRMTLSLRKWTSVDNPEKRWSTIFHEAFTHLSERDLEGLSEGQLRDLYALKYKHLKVDERSEMGQQLQRLQTFLKASEQGRPALVEVDWTQNPTYLKKMSLLGTLPKGAVEEMSPGVLEVLFDKSSARFSTFLPYLQGKLEAGGKAFAETERLKAALDYDTRFRELIVRNLGTPDAERDKELEALAQEFAKSLGTLNSGARRLVFGGTPAVAPKIGEKFSQSSDSVLKTLGFFMTPNGTGELAEKLSEYLTGYSEQLSNAVPGQHQERFRAILRDGLVAVFLPRVKQSLFEGRSCLGKVAVAPIELLRRGTEAALEYACSGYVQSLADQYLHFLTPEMIEKLRQAAIDGKLTPFLQNNIQSFFATHALSLRDLFAENFSSLTAHLPPLAMEILKMSGYGHFGSPEQTIGFEITRQPDGRYTLSVYATGAAVQLHPSISTPEGNCYQVPLHYKDLTLEQLDDQFFLRLFSHRAWPEWNRGGPYTLMEIHQSLLGTLDVAPQDVKADPKSLSPDAHLLNGSWGLLKLFLRQHLNFSSSLEERLFYFNLRKEAFLDAWRNVQQDLGSLRGQSRTLKMAAEELIQEAATLHEENALSFDDLKVLYATVWEAQDTIQKYTTVERSVTKKTMLPVEMQGMVSQLLDGLGRDFVRDLLVGALGNQAEESIRAVIDEIEVAKYGLPAISTPSRWDYLWRVQGWVFSELGINLNDFYNPTWRKSAFMVMRVASITLLPTLSVNLLVAYVAQRALRHVIATFLPEPMKRLYQFKCKLFAKVAADLFLDDAQRTQYTTLIDKWRSILTQTGEISYELSPYVQKTKPRSIRWVTTESTTPPRQFVSTVPRKAPLEPKTQEIDAKNALECMHQWLEQVKGWLPKDPFSLGLEKEQALIAHHYIFEQLQNLPTPLPGGQKDCWDDLPPHQALELVGELSFYQYNLYKIAIGKGELSREKRYRVVLTLFKIYIIIDKLSRRWPGNRLHGHKTNLWAIAIIQKSIHFRMTSRKTQEELKRIKEYCGLDPERTYTVDEVNALMEDSLFASLDSTSMHASIRGERCGNRRETAWFMDCLQDPLTQQKLQIRGLGPNSPKVDKLKCLYEDRPFNLASLAPLAPAEIDRITELMTDGDTNPRASMLPRYFFMLRAINAFSHTALASVTSSTHEGYLVSDLNKFGFNQAEDTHFLDMPVTLCVAGLSRVLNQSWLDRVTPDLRRLPLARSTIKDSMQMSIRPKQYLTHEYSADDADNWHRDVNPFHKSDPKSVLVPRVKTHWRQTPRPTNEIVNCKPKFDRCRPTPRLFGLFNSKDENAGLPSVFDKLSVQERMELEMIWSNPRDQAVRAFSFFSKILNKLTHADILGLCLKLSLNEDFLDSQLGEHAPFAEAVGEFFHQALALMKDNAPKFGDAVSQLIYFGILARAKCEAVDKEAGRHFPDFVPYIHARQAKDLLILPYFFIKPESANSATISQAVEDFCIAQLYNISEMSSSDLRLMCREANEIWKSTVEEVLNKNKRVRDRVLTRMAIMKNLVADGVHRLSWTGTYPDFTSDGLSISFKDAIQVQSKVETDKKEILEVLSKIFGSSALSGCTLLQHDPFTYRLSGHDLFVELHEHQNDKSRIRVRMVIEGETYHWVSLEGENEAQAPFTTCWLQERNSEGASLLLTLEKGVVKSRQTLYRGIRDKDFWEASFFNVSPEILQFFGVPCEEVELSDLTHGLELLAWFQPLSSIRALRSLTPPHDMVGLVFKDLNLTFKVDEVQGKNRHASSAMKSWMALESCRSSVQGMHLFPR